ncbi:MAG: thiamine phosphate synthase [Xenococcaceae cyanobacterium MO_167.B52]|nr:thiamine phosphate synthase [Xenococcaceae cyanobacterium MO_167.B52]
MYQAVYRILDANLDRAREGLRIIEEWCRFGLNNATLAEECKNIRQELAKLHHWEIRQARNTANDVGTELSHPQEEVRDSIDSILQANLCRTQEALRVLEEYGKLYNPQMGGICKKMRYRVYTLETSLLDNRRYQQLNRSSLYLVTSPEENLFQVVESALQAGLTLVQYRDKESHDSLRLGIAQQLCQLCHEYNALFIVNDRVDLALAVNADGVHLGQQDIPVSLAREVLGFGKIVGRSTTNKEELSKALSESVDYVGVGPIYQTPTKPGKPAANVDYIKYVIENCPIPWFAIGGINLSNIGEVLSAGIRRVAVVRAIMQAEQPDMITRQFINLLYSQFH